MCLNFLYRKFVEKTKIRLINLSCGLKYSTHIKPPNKKSILKNINPRILKEVEGEKKPNNSYAKWPTLRTEKNRNAKKR